MKTWRSLFLSAAIATGLLCGCGKAPPEDKPVPRDTPKSAPKQPKAEVNTANINNATASSATTYAVAALSQNNASVVAKSETRAVTVGDAGPAPSAEGVKAVAGNEAASVAPAVLAIGVPTSPPPQGAIVRLTATQGSKVRIDGTANIFHTRWAVEGKLIGGFIEAGPGFPIQPGQALNSGGIQAHVEAFIPVRSLKSVEDDGKPYSDKMDDIMYGKLKAQECPRILYRLTKLARRNAPEGGGTSYPCDAKGDLVVAGVTNSISMPVTVQPLGNNKVKISGSTEVKMTQFKIQPPEVNLIVGKIVTGDVVKLTVDWVVEEKKTVAAASE